jgi:hypothetical protein
MEQAFGLLSYKGADCRIAEAVFQEVARTKMPTNDPNCPPHVCNVKGIYYNNALATDGLTGGSEDGGDLDNERDGEFEDDNNKRDGEYKEDDEEEDGMAESNNNSSSFSADKQEQLTVANHDGGQLDVVAATACGRRASDGDQSVVAAALAGKRRLGEAASSKEARKGGQ